VTSVILHRLLHIFLNSQIHCVGLTLLLKFCRGFDNVEGRSKVGTLVLVGSFCILSDSFMKEMQLGYGFFLKTWSFYLLLLGLG